MSKKIRRPQATKRRNFESKQRMDRDTSFAPKTLPNKKRKILEARHTWRNHDAE